MRIREVVKVLGTLALAYIGVIVILYFALEEELKGEEISFSVGIGEGLSNNGLQELPQFEITSDISLLTTSYLLILSTTSYVDKSTVNTLVSEATNSNADAVSCYGSFVSAYITNNKLEIIQNASHHKIRTNNCKQTNILSPTCLLIKKQLIQLYFDQFSTWNSISWIEFSIKMYKTDLTLLSCALSENKPVAIATETVFSRLDENTIKQIMTNNMLETIQEQDNIWQINDGKIVLSHPQWIKVAKNEETKYAEEALLLFNLQNEMQRKMIKNWGFRKQSLGRSGDIVSMFIDAEIPGVWEPDANKTYKLKIQSASFETELEYSHALWENIQIPEPQEIYIIVPLRDTGLYKENILDVFETWITKSKNAIEGLNIVLYIVHFRNSDEIKQIMQRHSVKNYELFDPNQLLFSNQVLNNIVMWIDDINPLIILADISVPLSSIMLKNAVDFTIPGKKVWVPYHALNVDEIKMMSFYRNDFEVLGMFTKKQWHTIENVFLLESFQKHNYVIHKTFHPVSTANSEIPGGLRFWADSPSLLLAETKPIGISLFPQKSVSAAFVHWKSNGAKSYEIITTNGASQVSTLLQLELHSRLLSVTQPMAVD